MDYINIFKDLTTSELTQTDSQMFYDLLGDDYEKFVEFYTFLKDNLSEELIDSISCYRENGKIIFITKFTDENINYIEF